MSRIDLNADVGEGCSHDAALMPLVTSANIACGIHAGDVDTMREAVNLARYVGVGIGAHPSLNDRANFGRKEMKVTPNEVHLYVLTQTKLLQIIAKQCGARVSHVKPHGALYNMAARNRELADAVASAVYDVDPKLVLFGLSGSCLISAGMARGLRVANEVFADRTYQPDGSLTPRSQLGAMITDEDEAVAHVWRMIGQGVVRATDGSEMPVKADTVCVHGDGVAPVNFALKLRAKLKDEGFWLRSARD